MTSQRPYWCPKTMKQWPYWCPKPILWELNSFLMQTLSFVPINLHRGWPREWKHFYWPYLVPREILKAFYTPLQTNLLSSRKSTPQGENKFPHPPSLRRRWQISCVSSPCAFCKIFHEYLSIKRHRVPFMRTWIRCFCFLAESQVLILVIRNWVLWYY